MVQVIQRRMSNKVSFDRGWTAYKKGFGDLKGSYWFGEFLFERKINLLFFNFDTFLNIDFECPNIINRAKITNIS